MPGHALSRSATIALLVVLLASCGSPATPEPVGADALRNCGADVSTARPARIFAAFQNAIEAVYALGAGDRLVGAAYLDNPLRADLAPGFRPEADRPAYFPEEYPSRERVLRLAPDLVVSGFTGALTREGLGTRDELSRAGIRAYVFPQFCPTADGAGQTSLAANDVSLEGVYRNLADLGRLLGTPERATAVVDRMRATIADTQRRLAGVTVRPRVAMVNRPNPDGPLRVFGTGDVATTIIDAAGGTQAFPELAGRTRTVGIEGLVAARPDVIVVPACCGADVGPDAARPLIEKLRADPALAQVPAVRDGRLVAVTFAEVSPGVRNADAVANLARVLHPER